MPMRIAYVTPYDATDVSHWSGLGHFIGRALRMQSMQVDYVGPVEYNTARFARLKGVLMRRLAGGYWPQVEPAALRRVAAAEAAKLAGIPADVVLGLAADHLAKLDCRQPMVLWSDSPLAGLIGSYDYATGLSKRTLRHIHAAEQEAIDRCSAVVYTSHWAAEVVKKTYRVTPEKVHVIPFGANLETSPTPQQAMAAVDGRGTDACRLLFLGVDWNRKGGDIALEATRLLNSQGVPAKLLVLGCDPPPAAAAMPFVEPLGFVSKRTPEGRRRIADLIASSHFILLPTRAEAYGLVFAEASAYGVPSVTTAVGGVGGVVTDHVNGIKLPLDAGPAAYADYIRGLFRSPEKYRQLCRSAYDQFAAHLNWDVAGAAIGRVLHDVTRFDRA